MTVTNIPLTYSKDELIEALEALRPAMVAYDRESNEALRAALRGRLEPGEHAAAGILVTEFDLTGKPEAPDGVG